MDRPQSTIDTDHGFNRLPGDRDLGADVGVVAEWAVTRAHRRQWVGVRRVEFAPAAATLGDGRAVPEALTEQDAAAGSQVLAGRREGGQQAAEGLRRPVADTRSDDRRRPGRTLLDQASAVADASAANGIRRWIDEARTELAP